MNEAKTKTSNTEEHSSRLMEITSILVRNKLMHGMTPVKLRCILEELGPVYIKLGQIMSLHSDILPQAYCDELMKLNSETTPMPFKTVVHVLNESYGADWHTFFKDIEKEPLGSASIAQVHRAKLRTGEDVIIKVQREGVQETMERDIRLLMKAVRLLPPVAGIHTVIDPVQVLAELRATAREEMDFQKEAENLEEFERDNRDVAFVGVPKLYREYTTPQVLVMEYIDGCAINDLDYLRKNEYDTDEIGAKFADNYIKQFMEDGFFHADPHPGNVKIRDGKIIWIDMGMMGRLTERDRILLAECIRGIAERDIGKIENAVLALGDFSGKPDRQKLYHDLRDIVQQYSTVDIRAINLGEMLQTGLDAMKQNKIRMPHGLSMLSRGLIHLEGVLSEISPGISVIEIARARVRADAVKNFNLAAEIQRGGEKLYNATDKGLEIPVLMNDIMREYLNGQSRVNLDLKASRELAWLLRKLVQNIVVGMWLTALIIGSSIMCTTDMKPRIFGIPLLGFIGFSLALGVIVFLLLRHLLTRKK